MCQHAHGALFAEGKARLDRGVGLVAAQGYRRTLAAEDLFSQKLTSALTDCHSRGPLPFGQQPRSHSHCNS